MKGQSAYLATILVLAGVLVVACGQATPAPQSTTAPAVSTKATEPTRAVAVQPTAAAVQPTAAPAKAVDFPAKGKSITFVIPWDAGSSSDITARLLLPPMESALGTRIQVVNKPGASSQVGTTEMVRAKPDGYTMGLTNLPATLSAYLVPDRQAAFSRKDLQPVANIFFDPSAIAVRSDSPFKTMKDLIDAAKANPGKIKASTSGILSTGHISLLPLQAMTGAQITFIPFNGGGPQRAAILGGQVDLETGVVGDFVPGVKSGDLRVLAVLDSEENAFLPGVKTAEAQGYKLYASAARGISVPAGTPQEVVNILDSAVKKGMESAGVKAKMDEMGAAMRYLNSADYAKYWDDREAVLKPLLAGVTTK